MFANKIQTIPIFAALMALASACSQQPSRGESAAPIVGGDRDQHGCIASAGYAWCGRESSCVRSWELAQQKGFTNGVEAFERYCSSSSQ